MTPILASQYIRPDPAVQRIADRDREQRAAARRLRPHARRRPTAASPAMRALLVIALLALVGIASPRAAAMTESDFAGARGIYELESGELLTLFGHHPMLELHGEEIHLVSDGHDRYVADAEPPEEITLQRDATGAVTGVTVSRPGEPSVSATRIQPYVEHSVRFVSSRVELSGSLLVPNGAGPHPAVAVVHGAEYGTRETYRLMASHLARRGVATLIYDKRGTGESAGDFATATFDDLASDALAAVTLLRGHAQIDPARVGLAGMSQGGWVIAEAANRSRDVAFLIALSASGFTPAEQAAWLTGSMLAVRGFDQPAIDASARAWAMMYSSLDLVEAGIIGSLSGVPGFWFHALDPHLEAVRLWEQVRQPVLAFWGEVDCQVPAYDSLAILRAALERGPNRSHELHVLPGADHGLAQAGPCEREIGASHGGRYQYASGFLSRPAEWIHSLDAGVEKRSVVVPSERATSSLGWHQSTETTAPWFGSMAVQLGILTLLVGLFALIGLAAPTRRVVAAVRRQPYRHGARTHLWTLVGVVGLAATVTGATALAELLMLADLRSAPLIGGPSVDGVSAMFAVARALTAAAIVAGSVAIVLELHSARGRGARAILGGASVLLLTAWAAYWGFVPLPGLG